MITALVRNGRKSIGIEVGVLGYHRSACFAAAVNPKKWLMTARRNTHLIKRDYTDDHGKPEPRIIDSIELSPIINAFLY